MLKKTFFKTKPNVCKVAFELPATTQAETICVVGEFNAWDCQATPLKRKRDGTFAATLNLETGRAYRFRYLLDGTRWDNEAQADDAVHNEFGSQDSIVIV